MTGVSGVGGALVYRIHFTSQDLARTRVAEAPPPLLELDRAARALQDRGEAVRLDSWHRGVERLSEPARMVLSLIPPVGWSPTFVTGPQAGSLADLLERVHAVPERRIRAELGEIAEHQRLPAWTSRVTDDRDLRDRICQGLNDLFGALLAPCWDQVTAVFAADLSVRMRQLAGGGVERLLAQLNPQWVRWNAPVLEVRMINGAEHDLYLAGRGILLVPSMFGSRSLVDPDAQPRPTLSYPAGPGEHARRLADRYSSAAAVSALLGQTKAAVLATIAGHPGCSTTELAALARISAASASEHTTVLRQAGLVRTVRHRNAALHTPTALGTALLNGALTDAAGR